MAPWAARWGAAPQLAALAARWPHGTRRTARHIHFGSDVFCDGLALHIAHAVGISGFVTLGLLCLLLRSCRGLGLRLLAAAGLCRRVLALRGFYVCGGGFVPLRLISQRRAVQSVGTGVHGLDGLRAVRAGHIAVGDLAVGGGAFDGLGLCGGANQAEQIGGDAQVAIHVSLSAAAWGTCVLVLDDGLGDSSVSLTTRCRVCQPLRSSTMP